MNVALYVLLGVVLGCVIGWLVRSLRPPAPDNRLEIELRELVGARDSELVQERSHQGELNRQLATAQADLANERKFLAELRREVEATQDRFKTEFEAISNRLLLNNASRFNEQSSDSLKKLLDPLNEKLGEFKTSLDTTRMETKSHSDLLKAEISRIGTEAANLTKALRGDVKVLGNWGENMLDQILEKSGLQRDIHYRRQRGAKDVEGDQRFLDVIVNLPEKRNLIIDSKVTLRAFDEYVNCTDEAVRAIQLDKHAEAVRKHFHDLGSKRYQDIHGINAPDFVLMYVPIEAAFFAAIARDPGLFGEALEQNVVLITNSTLLATLRTVAHVWRLADQQKHAQEIADRGGKLYDKFVGFVEDLQSVGGALENAQRAWEGASNKLCSGSGNLVRQAEQLKTLGAKAAKTLPPHLVEKAGGADAAVAALPPVVE